MLLRGSNYISLEYDILELVVLEFLKSECYREKKVEGLF